MKENISNEGYVLISNEDFSHEGAIVSQYSKFIPTKNESVKPLVSLMVTFKGNFPSEENYRNYNISFSRYDGEVSEEISNEVTRIEEILFTKLVQLTNRQNVVREGEEKKINILNLLK